MDDAASDELARVAHDWDRAMVANDADAIGLFMADDWTIVGPDGSVGGKEAFVALIRSGALTHDVMTTEDMTVRVYGSTAVLTARGVSSGAYEGRSFRAVERPSNVFGEMPMPVGVACSRTCRPLVPSPARERRGLSRRLP